MTAAAPEVVHAATSHWHGGPDGAGKVELGGDASAATRNPSSATGPTAGTDPENLLCGAVATCFAITLGYMATRYGYTDAHVIATATMGNGTDNRMRVLSIALSCTFEPAGLPREKLEEALKKAEKGCIVARSIGPAVPVTSTLG